MQAEILKDFLHAGPLTLTVDGDCMQATLPDGAEIRVERHSFYWPGDVVVFQRSDGRLVSHRLLGYVPGRSGWNAMIQADHRTYADGPVARSSIIGRVTMANGETVRCSHRQRLSSLLRYVPAAVRWAARRIGNRGKK